MRAIHAAAVTPLALFSGVAEAQQTDASLGVYVGAEVGSAKSTNTVPTAIAPLVMNDSTTGWTVNAGFRPRKFLGAELSYTDFGNQQATNVQWEFPPTIPGDVTYLASARNTAIVGSLIGYLPIAHSGWDLFAKAGYASLTTKMHSNGDYPNVCTGQPCVPIGMASQSSSHQQGDFAYGAGAQYRIGSLGVRAEYQKVTTSGIAPSLISVGLIWNF